MNSESQPALPGTYYGELSPEGQWFWNGTGTPDDRWIANPQNVPVQQVQPTAKGSLHYVMGPIDAKVFQDHSSKPGPGGIQMTIGHCQTMNPADLIKAFNLTG